MTVTIFAQFYLFLLFFLCSCCNILAEWNTKDYLKREHSLQKPYNLGSTGTDGKWDIFGSTIVTNNYVRLTPDHQSRKGSVWNNEPCMIHNWELHVHFKIHGKGTELFGDGMAIWYTKTRKKLGPVFGSVNYFDGLGIFLDTYSNQNGPHNHGHPYISAMVNNGSMSYDHDRDGTHTELQGCESSFRGAAHDSYLAVRYENDKLTVSTDIDGKNAWKQCFSVEGVRLPTGYYFGASAATGDLADNHDIISMKVYDIDVDKVDTKDYRNIKPSADVFAPPRDHVDDPKGSYMLSKLTGWRLLVIIIVGVLGLSVCGMVAFIIYTKRQDDRRKRFY